jgi:hypothetical protein
MIQNKPNQSQFQTRKQLALFTRREIPTHSTVLRTGSFDCAQDRVPRNDAIYVVFWVEWRNVARGEEHGFKGYVRGGF